LIVYVNISARTALSNELFVVGYRGGREIERHGLSVAADRPRFVGTAELRSIPEEVALWVRCQQNDSLLQLARQPVRWPSIEAEAVSRPNRQINPIDLGAILVPYDWLLLASGQKAVVDVAALSRTRNIKNARLSAGFEGFSKIQVDAELVKGRRLMKTLEVPLPSSHPQELLQIRIMEGNRELWGKDIHTMVTAAPARWPAFGAVETKLRYDAPISVRDPKTDIASTLDYEHAWDPKLKDVVVRLPNGSRYVFWRGSNYIPFWAGLYNTGLSYEWAENHSQPVHHPDGTVDFPEPLFDMQLRYGRVRIVESTPARVHVRWSYQSTDIDYNVWGDQSTEDYYFYPDGFGTRVLSLTSTLDADYEISEFIILTPQAAYPLEVLPAYIADVLYLDGQKQRITLPLEAKVTAQKRPDDNKIPNQKHVPMVYRIRMEKRDTTTAIYFSPRDTTTPSVFAPFYDRGELVTPAYWGGHWPLGRGQWTGSTINARIHSSPAHNSLMTWDRGNRPTPLAHAEFPMLDTLGRTRPMQLRRWVWLIAKTGASDETLLEWAHSFSDPPSIQVKGARIDFPSYIPERRAIRLIAQSTSIDIELTPIVHTINPVFEIDHAPRDLVAVTIDGKELPADSYAWDGGTLWMKASIGICEATIRLRFAAEM
jgi:hypothetical protein